MDQRRRSSARSLVCFGNVEGAVLNGQAVEAIHSDLTAGSNLTEAKSLEENAGVAFQGPVKVGSFDIPGELARQWLKLPNPNGRPNSDVLRPWGERTGCNSRPSDTWIIDFGADYTEQEAALYEIPFAHVLREVKPMRDAGNREGVKSIGGDMAKQCLHYALHLLRSSVTIATPRVANIACSFGWM